MIPPFARACLAGGLLLATACSSLDSSRPVHTGPSVAPGDTGPARFVGTLYSAFDTAAAIELAATADNWYRTPGGEGYDATLDILFGYLSRHGFASMDGLELGFIESEMSHDSWTPRGGSVRLLASDGGVEVLHDFEHSGDTDRVILPYRTPAADVQGRPVFELQDVEDGTVLVIEASASKSVLKRAEKRGALAVLSSSLFPFTVDPTGAEQHRDAIQFTRVPVGTTIPVGKISPRSYARIKSVAGADRGVKLAFRSDVDWGGRELRTLYARIAGTSRPNEVVAIASHVQEPGAGDNASGIGGTVEIAASLAELIASGELARPARSVIFLWGDEFRQSEVWLDHTTDTVIAGISADMLGQSPERTGAIALLERMQDPGAVVTLPPDAHTPWGAGQVNVDELKPNGVALIARTALLDVADHVGGWKTAENPWEGGSDHDLFLKRGIPAVLMWHFTDFTYHTSLDRMEMLDGEELRRTTTAVVATALAIADGRSVDLDRYLASNDLELTLRVDAAREAGETDAAVLWQSWCDGAEEWLRELCSVE